MKTLELNENEQLYIDENMDVWISQRGQAYHKGRIVGTVFPCNNEDLDEMDQELVSKNEFFTMDDPRFKDVVHLGDRMTQLYN